MTTLHEDELELLGGVDANECQLVQLMMSKSCSRKKYF